MSERRYIHIRNWDRFQRFKDRRPTWLRLHLNLHRNDEYLALTGHRRAIVVGLWIEYAARLRQAPDDSFTICRGLVHDTAMISRQLALKVTTRDLELLNHAGFITFSVTETVTIRAASEPLEVEVDKNLARAREDPKPAQAERGRIPFEAVQPSRQLQRAEAFTRNAGHQYEPLGFEEELARFSLPPEEHEQIKSLYATLRTNGAEPDELPWEGDEPPIVT